MGDRPMAPARPGNVLNSRTKNSFEPTDRTRTRAFLSRKFSQSKLRRGKRGITKQRNASVSGGQTLVQKKDKMDFQSTTVDNNTREEEGSEKKKLAERKQGLGGYHPREAILSEKRGIAWKILWKDSARSRRGSDTARGREGGKEVTGSCLQERLDVGGTAT